MLRKGLSYRSSSTWTYRKATRVWNKSEPICVSDEHLFYIWIPPASIFEISFNTCNFGMA